MDRDELKKYRWRLLPWRIKIVFFLVALPLFLYTPLALLFLDSVSDAGLFISWVGGIVVYAVYESLCYNWYKEHGLL